MTCPLLPPPCTTRTMTHGNDDRVLNMIDPKMIEPNMIAHKMIERKMIEG